MIDDADSWLTDAAGENLQNDEEASLCRRLERLVSEI